MIYVNNYVIAIILCLQTACQSVISTVGQYIYASFLQIYPSSGNTTGNFTRLPWHSMKKSSILMASSESDAQLWAQEQSADLFFRIDLWNSCPLILTTYILGFYTPKLGRRMVLIFPILGTAIQLSIWLAIIYLHLADYWWYIASFIVGLSGSTFVFSRNTIVLIYSSNSCFDL